MTTVAFAHFIFCQVCHRMRSGMMRTGKTTMQPTSTVDTYFFRPFRISKAENFPFRMTADGQKESVPGGGRLLRVFPTGGKGTSRLGTFCHGCPANKRKTEVMPRLMAAAAPFFVVPPCPVHNILCPAKKNPGFSAKFSGAPPLSPMGSCGIMDANAEK